MSETFLTRRAAAAFVGVSRNTLVNWGITGKIKVYRNEVTGYRLYNIKDLSIMREKLYSAVKEKAPKKKIKIVKGSRI